MQFALLYVWVYRCVYRTSFRVWFRLCGLLVREAAPNNWLQNLRKDVAWLVSFKVASSDVWTILKGRTWSRMVDYRKNHRESCTTHPKECCIGINTSSTILLSHSLLCIPSVEKLLGPLVHSHNYISTRNNQYLLYRNSARNTHPLSTNLASRMARLSSKDILAAIYLVLVSNYFHIIN